MHDSTNCPFCQGRLDRVSEMRAVKVAGRKVQVRHNLSRCSACGTELFAPGEMDNVIIEARNTVRAAEGLLMSHEVVEIRSSLGLSQRGFERLLGVGEKTVVRWERGTVFQSKAADNLMRLIRDLPHGAELLAARNRVSIQRASYDPISIQGMFDGAANFVVEGQPTPTAHNLDASVADFKGLTDVNFRRNVAANENLALAS